MDLVYVIEPKTIVYTQNSSYTTLAQGLGGTELRRDAMHAGRDATASRAYPRAQRAHCGNLERACAQGEHSAEKASKLQAKFNQIERTSRTASLQLHCNCNFTASPVWLCGPQTMSSA